MRIRLLSCTTALLQRLGIYFVLLPVVLMSSLSWSSAAAAAEVHPYRSSPYSVFLSYTGNICDKDSAAASNRISTVWQVFIMHSSERLAGVVLVLEVDLDLRRG